VLASTTGDVATRPSGQGVDHGAPFELLFYQSNPTRWPAHPPAGALRDLWYTIPARAPWPTRWTAPALLIEGQEAAAALVILADQGRPGGGRAMPAHDSGTAMLIGPAWWPVQPPGPRGQAHRTLERNHIHEEG